MFTTVCRLCFALTLCVGLVWPALAVDAAKPSIGAQREGVLFWPQAERDAQFRSMYRRFPSDRAAHGKALHALPLGASLTIAGQRGDAWLAGYMAANHVAGVMVVHDGRVVAEHYALGFKPEERWTSFSVAKSVTSVLLGIALQRGDIHGMNDPLVRYIPELRGSAYADVTVQQLLTMTSGVRWNEDYDDAHSDVAQMYLGQCQRGEAHVLSYLKSMPRQWPAGTHWNYNTAEIDLLGMLVQRATHQSLASYLAQTIWRPYGMASDAYWIKDECDGSDTGGSGLSATLADYARFGEFMLGGGKIDGRPVIAPVWLAGATHEHAAANAPPRGYGYLWWTDTDGSYAAIGIFGQMVYVDPARHLVIAQVASWPAATSKALMAGRRAFVSAIKQAVDSAAL